jgi:hypothetical protein
MTPLEILAVLVGVFSVGFLPGHLPNRRRARERRALARAPRKHVAELVDAEVACVEGVVRRVAPSLEAPLTGRRAVFWSVRLEERDFTSQYWKELDEGSKLQSFDVVEDGKAVRVETEVLAFPDLELDHVETTLGSTLAPRQRALLEAAQVEVRPYAHQEYRFREAVLAEGDLVQVDGRVSVVVDPRGERESFRAQPVLRVLRGTKAAPLLIRRPRKVSDTPARGSRTPDRGG